MTKDRPLGLVELVNESKKVRVAASTARGVNKEILLQMIYLKKLLEY